MKFGKSSVFKTIFDFEVKRVGNDPMVAMTITDDRSQWGLNFEVFEVTISDTKSIEKGGW